MGTFLTSNPHTGHSDGRVLWKKGELSLLRWRSFGSGTVAVFRIWFGTDLKLCGFGDSGYDS